MNLSWYLARAGGLVAWALLSLSVLLGLILSTKIARSRPRPAWTLDLHRFLGGAAVAFTGIHLGALVADPYVHFGPAELLLPLASRWHPVAVAWGVVALWLMIAIEGTSLAMRRLSNATWKRVHRLSFVLFVLASWHAIAAGTDTATPLVVVPAVVFSGLIALLWMRRLMTIRRVAATPARRPGAPRPREEAGSARARD